MPRNRAIDAALISDLVDRFYGRIRLEPLMKRNGMRTWRS